MSGNAEIISAYEKMIRSGKASKPIIISQPTPENPNGRPFGGEAIDPLKVATGEVGEPRKIINENEPEPDYSDFDDKMRNLIAEKKRKMSESNGSDEMSKLKRRIEKIEEALTLVMDTQTKLLKKG